MINKIFLTIISIFLISGCSFFTKKVESLIVSESDESKAHAELVKPIKKNLYCTDNSKTQLLLEDETTLKYYQQFIPKFFDTKEFSFIQKASLLSLIEMLRRPDKATPTARLQYFLRINNKNYYFDFKPNNMANDSKMPYLKGIDYLLKNFDSKKSLVDLTNSIDQYLPANMIISPDLEDFLQKNKQDIINNDVLAETFLKGDEVLTKHETFKRMSLKKFISTSYRLKVTDISNYEFSKSSLMEINTSDSLKIKCNVDINKESSAKEDVNFSDNKLAHYFAIKDGDNFFIAVSTAIIQRPLQNLGSTYFIKAKPSPSPQPVCQFNNPEQDMVLFSTKGRNSAQHLKHLVSYDIELVDSYRSLDEILLFSRHLFLTNPDRILYESKRGRKSQLDFFLTMNFPIYHVDSLGDIMGFASFKNGSRSDKSLISDDRSQSRLWCQP